MVLTDVLFGKTVSKKHNWQLATTFVTFWFFIYFFTLYQGQTGRFHKWERLVKHNLRMECSYAADDWLSIV